MKLLTDKTNAQILELLMRKECSFSEILKSLNLKDHGQLNYHLKSLIQQNLIQKKDQKYVRTIKGERVGSYLQQIQSKETFPLSVVCAVIKNEKEEILWLKRSKSPQKEKWGLPGGKARIGETVKETAQREVFEETGLKLKFEKFLGFFPCLNYESGELIYHSNISLVSMSSVNSNVKIKIDPEEHNDYRFVKLEKIEKDKTVANTSEVIKEVLKKNPTFKEFVLKN